MLWTYSKITDTIRESAMSLRLSILIPLLFAVTPGIAEQEATPLSTDARIQSVVYHPDNVVKLYAHHLFPTVVTFAPYETIVFVNVGDTVAWKVQSAHNRLIIKPVVLGKNVHTNLHVITSANREYLFTLIGNYTTDPKDPRMVYKLKFSYPEDDAAKLNATLEKKKSEERETAAENTTSKDPSLWNLNYSYKGDRSLLPTRVFDNGQFTYFEFPKEQSLPAIFYVYPTGKEALVNYRVEGKYLVAERIGGQYTLRSDKQTACVFNEPFLIAYREKHKHEHKVHKFNAMPEKQAKGASKSVGKRTVVEDSASSDEN